MPRRSLIAAAFAMLALGGCSLGNDSSKPAALGTKSSDKDAAAKLGFPSTATKNTVRIGGGDATADAAGVANLVYPAEQSSSRPGAVVLIDKNDWQAGVTAAVLSARPIGAPLLLADGGSLSPATKDTLSRLKPKGSDLAKDAQIIRIGSKPAKPSGYKTAIIEGKDPYERANAIDAFWSSVRGKPSRSVIVASGEQAAYAMPAAAWAGFSGDNVLLTKAKQLPKPTATALRRHQRPDIYVLGPASVISDAVVKDLGKFGKVHRIGPDPAVGKTIANPIDNAIAFSRYSRGSFGWGFTNAGNTYTIANADRPLDAAPSALLASQGIPPALLLTDSGNDLPQTLQTALVNVQPGYEDDRRTVAYSRSWILGGDKAVSLSQQDEIDSLQQLVPIQANSP